MGRQGLGPGTAPGRALIAVEGDAASRDAVERLAATLRAAGHEVLQPPVERALGRPPSSRVVIVVPVTGAHDAGLAVQAALRGFGLLAINHAPRDVADRLYDDLRRFGRLEVRSVEASDDADRLSPVERELLDALASGLSLGEAAASLHLSRRTADRRLSAARRALGATTTAEAVSRLRPPPAA